jgi:hypothetical protein
MELDTLKAYRAGLLWKHLNHIGSPAPMYLNPLAQDVDFYEPSPFLELRKSRRVIHHYTGVEGLLGIIQSNKLFATSAYYLNDSSEVEYGIRLVLEVLEDWLEPNKDNLRFAIAVLRILYKLFQDSEKRALRSERVYVACFCDRENLLSQWRAYGQKGGYSLAFELSANSIALDGPPGFGDVRLARVEYRRFAQYSAIQAIVKDSILQIAKLVDDNPPPSPETKGLLSDIVEWFEEMLLQQIVTFKHPAFKDEREWRIIVRPDKVSCDESIKFRTLRGSLIPYVELSPRRAKLPISSVYFGPSLEPSRTKKPIEMLLRANGFGSLEVNGTDIPVIL